jgi:hypothetical protein
MKVKIGSQMDHIVKCINSTFAKKVFSTDDIAGFLCRKHGFNKLSIRGLVTKYHDKSPGSLIRRGYYKNRNHGNPIFHFLYCTKGNSKLFKNVKLKKAKGNGNRW